MNPLFRKEFRNILRCKCGWLIQETSEASKESTASPKAQTQTTNDENQGTISQESCVLTRGDNEGTELKEENHGEFTEEIVMLSNDLQN